MSEVFLSGNGLGGGLEHRTFRTKVQMTLSTSRANHYATAPKWLILDPFKDFQYIVAWKVLDPFKTMKNTPLNLIRITWCWILNKSNTSYFFLARPNTSDKQILVHVWLIKEIVHIYLFVDQALKESVHKVKKKLDGSLNG